MVFITEVESVYCAVRFESLYITDTIRLRRVKKTGRLLYGPEELPFNFYIFYHLISLVLMSADYSAVSGLTNKRKCIQDISGET